VVTDVMGAAVVPVSGALTPAESSSEATEPWRMLADGTGMLVAWEPAPQGAARWGTPLAASSGLARQLLTVVERAGSKLPTAGETLFRLELPAGQTVSNLIPAVGGGFRGMTRLAGSSKIANHAKLLPVGGAAAGTAVALGPLLGIVALSVGAEMLANHQQEAKLEAIRQVVDRLENHQLNKLIAALDSADHVLEDSMAALLDRLEVPEAVGLGTTAARVKEIKALTLNWIREWEKNVEQFADTPGGVPYDDLEAALGRVGIGGFPAFGLQVQLAYRALALDSRTHIVAMAEATMGRPEETVEHFHATVQRRLADNADHFERLATLLWKLASTRLTVGVARVDRRNRPAELQWRMVRVARALTEAPSPPPMLTADHHLVLEAVRRSDGTVTVLAPRAELAS
jgi:hypothetical protein